MYVFVIHLKCKENNDFKVKENIENPDIFRVLKLNSTVVKKTTIRIPFLYFYISSHYWLPKYVWIYEFQKMAELPKNVARIHLKLSS